MSKTDEQVVLDAMIQSAWRPCDPGNRIVLDDSDGRIWKALMRIVRKRRLSGDNT